MIAHIIMNHPGLCFQLMSVHGFPHRSDILPTGLA